MADQLSLSNRALLGIGARTQVSSISPSDGSEEANAISVLWNSTYEQLARAAQWGCLRNEQTLSLLAASCNTPENPNGVPPFPPQPWLYMYAYPSDCLDMRWLVPYAPNVNQSTPPQTTVNNGASSWIPGQGQINYARSYHTDANGSPIQVILTNQEYAIAVYTVNQPNPAAWDSLFQQAFVAALGAYLVPALSLSLPLMDRCIKQAEVAIAQARVADGNEGVTKMDHLPDWMIARTGSPGMYGTGYNGYGYNDMVWPDGGNAYV